MILNNVAEILPLRMSATSSATQTFIFLILK